MATAQATDKIPGELKDVPGWFPPLDQLLFTWFLERQETRGLGGDLVELGAYMGKSAILLGHHLQDGEKFTVCDLFGGEAPDGANAAETAKSYSSLTRQTFERNYLAFHDALPKVIEAPTSVISGEVETDSCRFVHIDASHLYEHVHDDIGAARDLLLPDGIVVLDDFRSEHTPGVSVATWEAVLNRGLHPICLSTQKLYGTWGDAEPIQEELLAMLRERSDCGLSVQDAAGHRLVRTRAQKGMQPPSFPHSRHYAAPRPPKPAATATASTSTSTTTASRPGPRPRPRSRARRIGADLLPPIVTRALRRTLARSAQGSQGRA